MNQSIRQTVPKRQEPWRRRYQAAPDAAWISDHARAVIGDAADPFHGEIEPANNGGERWRYGIHRAVGGDHDAPNPGDLLCSALAACLHSTTRMLADWVGVDVRDITVSVSADVDVRGALMVDPDVPVGFQRLHCEVCLEVPAGTDGQSLKALMHSAERSCVVMQTLDRGTGVDTNWHIDQEVDTATADQPDRSPTRREVQS